MKAIELFAGVGGFRLGLEANGCQVVWANEWDKYAAQTYNKNFGGQIDTRDITTIREFPDHELLVGGFPCQAFSVAGKRAGFNETRGTLFFDIARILKDKQPRNLLLENVKGLLSHDNGKTFQTIIGVLTDLGYWVEWQVLNSKDFGVPQNRERVFIVGHLGGEPSRKVFPILGSNGKDIKQVGNIDQQGHNSLWGRVYDPAGISSTLNAHGGGLGAKTGLYLTKDEIVDSLVDEGLELTEQGSKTLDTMVSRQPLRFLDRNQKNIEGDYAYTVDSTNTGGVAVANRIRKLTPLETERLQGFPDNWTKYGVRPSNPGIDDTPQVYEQSDTQRYKMMGNAVTVNVIKAIVERLI